MFWSSWTGNKNKWMKRKLGTEVHRWIKLRKWKGFVDHNIQPYKTGLLTCGFLVIHSSVVFKKHAKNTKSGKWLIFVSLEITFGKPLPTKILFSLWAFLFLHTFANKCLSCHKNIFMFGLFCPQINIKFPGWFEIFWCFTSSPWNEEKLKVGSSGNRKKGSKTPHVCSSERKTHKICHLLQVEFSELPSVWREHGFW